MSAEPLYGCDLCGMDWPLDEMATLGGDRETGMGLVAVPSECWACRETR